FLRQAAAASAPLILPGALRGETPPSEQITLGFIGMGIQNRGLMNNFLRQDGTQVVAVCDVDKNRRDDALRRVNEFYSEKKKSGWKGCLATNDFREIMARDDIDAVCIATPDHWHAVITIKALESGKDVYCEKPLTHNIHESIEVMNAVNAHERVLQTGSMQRSMTGFRTACELAQNGLIGKITRVECSFGDPGRPCDLPEEKMEPGLDWDRWLGPAQPRPYNEILSPRGVHNHFPSWRNYQEFGGGMVTDWGAHHLDIAQWGLGMDESGPVEIRPPANEGDKRGARLLYANGVEVIHKNGIGVHFFGEDGEIGVNRGAFMFKHQGETVSQFRRKEDGGSHEGAVAIAEKRALKDAKIKLYRSTDHLRDFLTSVRARKKPITHEGVGARTAICCHLMNQAYYNHTTLKWDPKALTFTDGTGDAKWLTRDYRGEWKV
ncbi:MAG: Gfo/Idh/MocA family oxidoreductase, partial [Verrucomicrobiota bacterium]